MALHFKATKVAEKKPGNCDYCSDASQTTNFRQTLDNKYVGTYQTNVRNEQQVADLENDKREKEKRERF